MFKAVKCKGMLLKAMNKNIPLISLVSFIIFTIPLIIVCLSNSPDSSICRISAALLLWYMLSLFSLKREGIYKNDLNKVFTFPVWISVKTSVLIFKFFLKRKYPEIAEEHYERWVKLQKIKRKINGQWRF